MCIRRHFIDFNIHFLAFQMGHNLYLMCCTSQYGRKGPKLHCVNNRFKEYCSYWKRHFVFHCIGNLQRFFSPFLPHTHTHTHTMCICTQCWHFSVTTISPQTFPFTHWQASVSTSGCFLRPVFLSKGTKDIGQNWETCLFWRTSDICICYAHFHKVHMKLVESKAKFQNDIFLQYFQGSLIKWHDHWCNRQKTLHLVEIACTHTPTGRVWVSGSSCMERHHNQLPPGAASATSSPITFPLHISPRFHFSLLLRQELIIQPNHPISESVSE